MAETEKAEATLWDVLREFLHHSTISGADQDRLKRSLDVLDPDVDDADVPPVPETPEEELARLRAESKSRAEQDAAQASPEPPADEPAAGPPSFLAPQST
jgi:hypothetical protein